jgi:outer membrane receptor protein involved in Fe transport
MLEHVIGRNFMRITELKTCASALAIGVAVALAAPAYAQATPADDAEATGLDEIVVTASGKDRSQLNSSVAVTTVNAETIQSFHPSSEAEALRLIPGIQVAGTSGPGGNSNIAVRGLPVATGGSPFVQLQEDGLPTVLFGDIQFGNNDYWTHLDATVADIQAVRGGGATTFASQAPGAVINYISHTGKEDGGFVGLSKGINFNETKLDARYGGHLNENTYFHIGGYFKTGHGPLHAGYNVSKSYQIKANITQEFAGGRGFSRFYVKLADTQEPNYTGSPALATISGNQVSNIQPFPGFDGRKQSNYSIYNRTMTILNRNRQLETVDLDGITTNAKSIANQFHYEFSDALKFDNNVRYTKMRGGFASPFLNVSRAASIIGSQLSIKDGTNLDPVTDADNGRVYATVGSIRYASGPKAGQTFTGTYVTTDVNVRTNIRDIGSFADDLVLSGKYNLGGLDLTARAGYFYMKQKIAMDWHVNKSLRELSGDNPSQLDLYTAAGAKLTQNGISGYNNNWGDCCARDYALSYTNTAPYLSLDVSGGGFQIDGSVRFESVKARGGGTQGVAIETFVNSSGVQIPAITSSSARESLNYKRSYTSWTVGGGFKPTENTNIFARVSNGGRFNSDRQTFGNKIRNTGELCTSDDLQLKNALGVVTRAAKFGCGSDGVTPSVDFVRQYEVGVKNQGDIGAGRYSFQISLLKANFKQSTYELSATRCGGVPGGCVIDAKYKSSGAEFTATYNTGGFSLFGNATYTKSKQFDDRPTVNKFTRARGLSDLTYNLVANYDFNEMLGLGIGVTGQSSQLDDLPTKNGRSYPGGAVFNGNLRVSPMGNLELGVNVYNLFNKFDFRGNGGVADASVTPNVISGAPAIGRTITGSVKVKF